MNLLSRLTTGLLCLAGSLPLTAGTIWTSGIDAGPLPATAQMIWGDNGCAAESRINWRCADTPLDAIFGNLPDVNAANMFQILITDPLNFTAQVSPDPFDSTSQVIPQIFLFDGGGSPIAGAFAAFTADATLPFGPNLPGYYYLMVNSVGRDPIFTANLPDGTAAVQPLFCQDFSFDASAWLPCAGAETQPVSGYQGQGLYGGAYTVFLTGVTAPAPAPEPGSVVLLLSGMLLIGLTLAGKKRASAAASRASCDTPS